MKWWKSKLEKRVQFLEEQRSECIKDLLKACADVDISIMHIGADEFRSWGGLWSADGYGYLEAGTTLTQKQLRECLIRHQAYRYIKLRSELKEEPPSPTYYTIVDGTIVDESKKRKVKPRGK